MMEKDIIVALRGRRIPALRSAAAPGWHGATISMAAYDAERFIDILLGGRPVTDDDGLAMRIFGRPQDLVATDEPWTFEASPGLSDLGLAKLRVIVGIPADDVDEVVARLRAIDPSD